MPSAENSPAWYWFCIAVLVNWRLSHLICFENGPFTLLLRLRRLLYLLHLGKLIECFHCTAFWMALVPALAIYPLNGKLFLLIPAISAGASLLQKIISHDNYQSFSEQEDEV